MPLVQIQGQIERITYVNPETNYTVAKLHLPGRRDLVTVLGSFPSLNPGEVVKLLGEWGQHPKFGEQFKVVKYETITPATARGIEKCLGSGLIKGIGPVTARRIVARFGVPRRFALDPVSDIQVLTPMYKGLLGATNLNAELQRELNPGHKEVTRGGRTFKMHNKVMQIRNNYDKEVFNGDIGQITGIDLEKQQVTVSFDGRPVSYDLSELDELVLAYAVSVHKSQGSEYPVVILPVMTQHYMLLQRNLLYTAVTRAKKLAVLIGTPKALAIAVKNDRVQKRYTRLAERLKNAP